MTSLSSHDQADDEMHFLLQAEVLPRRVARPCLRQPV